MQFPSPHQVQQAWREYWRHLFAPIISREIRLQILVSGIIFLGIYLAFYIFAFVPWYKDYTEFWDEYGYGARSPFGPPMFHVAWILALVLVIMFVVVIWQLRSHCEDKILRRQRELVAMGVDPMNVFLETEALRKYSTLCPRCNSVVVTYPKYGFFTCSRCRERIVLDSVTTQPSP